MLRAIIIYPVIMKPALQLEFSTHGGRRKGAGRPRGERVSHAARPEFTKVLPVLVTLRDEGRGRVFVAPATRACGPGRAARVAAPVRLAARAEQAALDARLVVKSHHVVR